MTEFSFCWGCDPTGDGGSGSFNLTVVEKFLRYTNNLNPNSDGVIYWTQSPYNGLYAATNPGGNTVRIASGVGMVEGWIHESDADVDFDVSGGAANAIDQIVLRRSNPGAAPQTVRLALLRGPAGTLTPVTQTSSVWEVALWQVQLDGSGNFSSLTDVRKLVNTPVGSMVKINEFDGDGVTTTINFTNIPDVFNHLKIFYSCRLTGGATLGNGLIRFNGDSGANYEHLDDRVTEAGGGTGTYSAGFSVAQNFAQNLSFINTGGVANYQSSGEIYIPNYRSPFYKQVMTSQYLNDGNGIGTGTGWQRYLRHGDWKNTAVINRVAIICSNAPAVGSKFSLYAYS